MIWNKPKNVWQSLMLISPGAASVLFTAIGKMLPKDDEMALGLPVTFILCVVIGYLLARKTGRAPAKSLRSHGTFHFSSHGGEFFHRGIGGCALADATPTWIFR